jgi:hypothetical protein
MESMQKAINSIPSTARQKQKTTMKELLGFSTYKII